MMHRFGLILALLATAPGIAAAQSTIFRGTVSYEKIPVTLLGLQLGQPVRTPAAGVKVELVAAVGRAVLGSAFTDRTGAFRLEAEVRSANRVYLRALAQTENARVIRASDRAEYAVTSPVLRLAPGREVRQDLLATDSTRIAGPFNIATTIWRANQLIRSVQPAAVLPPVRIRWDTTYVGGTYFDYEDSTAFINGKRSEDSDEYDDHVILHEYGHFLMASFSREDSPGGDHGVGEELDPRLAWSEGWADFFSGAVTGSPRYLDSGATRGRQRILVTSDLEQDIHPRDRPGIWSEHSVGSALWDWYDTAAEPADSVSLGFAPMWTAFSGPLRKEPDAYLLDFVAALSRAGVPARSLSQVLGRRGISYPQPQHVFPQHVESGAPVVGTVDSRASRRSNMWRSSAHYWFALPTAREVNLSLKITGSRTPRHADLDLYLFDQKGERVAYSDDTNGVDDGEDIAQRLPAGYYRVEVRSWSGGEGSRLGDGNANQGTFRLVVRY
jgi:hypothetical protein